MVQLGQGRCCSIRAIQPGGHLSWREGCYSQLLLTHVSSLQSAAGFCPLQSCEFLFFSCIKEEGSLKKIFFVPKNIKVFGPELTFHLFWSPVMHP